MSGLVWWLIVGGMAGLLAGLVMKGGGYIHWRLAIRADGARRWGRNDWIHHSGVYRRLHSDWNYSNAETSLSPA
jgi:hypothetical protein